MIHDNSIQAFHEEEPKLSKRAEAIYQWILEHGPRTDREICREMGFGQDMNAVRPRCTELLQAGRLMEVCNRKCPVTGKRVRVVDISRPRGQILLLLQNAGMPCASVQINAIPETPGIGRLRDIA